MKITQSCNVCNSKNLQETINFPNLPLTGLYLDKPSLDGFNFNQSFLYCENCGHGQLKYIIDPEFLYDATYTHRTSASQISIKGNDFFYETLKSIISKKKYNQILEIGCNDMYLIDKLENKASNILGIDPVWDGKKFNHSNNIVISGKYIEQLEESDFSDKPDLVISSHTFEHINNTFDSFQKIVDFASDDALFLIEVPSLENTILQKRFDQVFHQHLQYFSLSSASYLISRLNCEFLGYKYNYSYWGGTFLFWFTKKGSNKNEYGTHQFDSKLIRSLYSDFKNELIASKNQLMLLDKNIYGFGAAQMLPILAYHMDSNLEFMKAIIDDNSERIGTYLPYINSPIISVNDVDIENSTIVITALDSSRNLMKRILELNPRRIFSLSSII